MFCILSGLAHLHSKQIIHRDIKLENILIYDYPNCVIVNFYNSEIFKPSLKKCGTPGYVAPEIFHSDYYDSKVDIFSAGVIFYYLIYGILPFESDDLEETIELNEKGNINFNIL